MDPALVSHALKLFEPGTSDLVTNVQVRTFPKGLSVEVIRTQSLVDQLDRVGRGDDREHVTTVFYRHPEHVRITNFESGTDAGAIQLSVDTEDDLRNVERLLAYMGPRSRPMGWRQIIELAANPQVIKAK
jgi:spore coat polysaccharide biosynthesis protein SpsF